MRFQVGLYHGNFNLIKFKSVFNDNIESFFIEIDKDAIHYNKSVIVGVVYSPPDFDVTTFKDEIN